MIDLVGGIIAIGDDSSVITSWVVWYKTPFGLFVKLEEAIKRCQDNDMDPRLMIVPVPVAVGNDGMYEVQP